jgi:tetratricopeptide (TPR) repeat protein
LLAALKDLNELIDLEPKNAVAYYLRALVRVNALSQYGEAINDLRKAVELDPKFTAAHLHLAALWLAMAEMAANDDGRSFFLKHAVSAYDQTLRLSPQNVNALLERARCRRYQHEYKLGLLDCEAAIRLNERSGAAYGERSAIRLASGDAKGALDDAEQVLKSDPKSHEGHMRKGEAHRALGDYKAAASDFDQAARSDPNRVSALIALAELLATCPDAGVRDGQRAIKLGRQACKLTKGQNLDALSALAAAYAEIGRFDVAVKGQKHVLEGIALYERDPLAARERLKLYEQGMPYRAPGPQR